MKKSSIFVISKLQVASIINYYSINFSIFAASHPPETVIRAPSVIAPVIPTVSLSVPVHAVPAIPPAGVSTVYTPSVLTVMRRPVVTGFLHSPLPHHPPPLPPIPHSPVVPIVHHHHTSTGAPTPVPVYATFISHGPPNVKQRTVLLHHHHHHHRHVEAKVIGRSTRTHKALC